MIASDGDALILLQKEFPKIKSFELPSYQIEYAKKGNNLTLKLLSRIPKIARAVKKEKKCIQQIIEKENIAGIISDSRMGVLGHKIPSVYITHQLNVFSGFLTPISSKIHQKFIQRFDECWVPDFKNEPNFSGKLGHLERVNFNLKYIGILSRFKPAKLRIKYDLLVVLSGPEPQRTLLEKHLLKELSTFKGKILFVRGVVSAKENIRNSPTNMKVVNYMLSNELEAAFNETDTVIARSGYSTIMDLAMLGKKVFFIPTPGQTEQEYLARMFRSKLIAPKSSQHNFSTDKLKKLEDYSGFDIVKNSIKADLFELFNCK